MAILTDKITADINSVKAKVKDIIQTLRSKPGRNIFHHALGDMKINLQAAFKELREHLQTSPPNSPEYNEIKQLLTTISVTKQIVDNRELTAQLPNAPTNRPATVTSELQDAFKGSQQDNKRIVQDVVRSSVRADQIKKRLNEFLKLSELFRKNPKRPGLRTRAQKLSRKLAPLLDDLKDIAGGIAIAFPTNEPRMPTEEERAVALVKHMQEKTKTIMDNASMNDKEKNKEVVEGRVKELLGREPRDMSKVPPGHESEDFSPTFKFHK